MTKEVFRFLVQPQSHGERLDLWLTEQGLPHSRSQLRRRIEEGEVLVEGRPAKAGQKLRPGQEVLFHPPPPRPVEDQPEAIPLDILYEDQHLIVVVKPAGMVVHPAPGHETGTLVNALLHHCGPLPRPPAYERQGEEEEGGELSIGGEHRPGVVHRLDQGTSGVLVCAKDEVSLVGLQRQFQAHSIERRYLAVAEGVVPAAGTIRTRYGRHATDRKRFTGRGGSRHAVTHYRVVERLVGASLLAVTLETGRTHQIRVHLSEAGYPLLGDPLYGRRPQRGNLREVWDGLGRQALHAEVLGFRHPVSREALRFQSPPPADMLAVLRALRATVEETPPL